MKTTRRGAAVMVFWIMMWSASVLFSLEFLYQPALLISGAIAFSAFLTWRNGQSLFLMLFIQQRSIRRMESIHVEYILSNKSFIPIFSAHVEILLMKELGLDTSEEGFYAFNPYEIKSIKRRVPCHKRGFYTVGALKVIMMDPLGLFVSERHIERRTEVTVLPGFLESGPISHHLQMIQASELERIRPYVPSDALKRIHWKATGRYQELMVKEFKETGLQMMRIILAGGSDAVGSLSESQREILVDLATSVLINQLEEGLKVEMVYVGYSSWKHTYFIQVDKALALEHGTAFEFGGGTSISQLEGMDVGSTDSSITIVVGVRPDFQMASAYESLLWGGPSVHLFLDDVEKIHVMDRNEFSS